MPTFNPVARDVGDFESLANRLGLTDRMAQILSSRGVTEEDDLDYSLRGMLQPDTMPGIEQATSRLIEAIENNERVIICGDFDADGATSIALCMLFFRKIGFANVDFRVPNRQRLGYGLTPEFIEEMLPLEPDLLVTVDNGVASNSGVDFANEQGIDVIVTDHHLPNKEEEGGLPDAYAIVNPNLPDSSFDSAPCGVGVVFYLLGNLRRSLINSGYFETETVEIPVMTEWLDLVALGTVADMVPLDLNNRRLVNEGMKRIRAGLMQPGVAALCMVSKTNPKTMTTKNIGFRLAPRINAAGRMSDISVGIKLLIAEDEEEATALASHLDGINNERREIQRLNTHEALKMLELLPEAQASGFCLHHEDFKEGVVGLVATKVVRDTGYPAVVFAENAYSTLPGGELRGSARSVEGLHIRDILSLIHNQHPSLILKFGGHAGAAGLTIAKKNFQRFSTIFEDVIRHNIPASAIEGTIVTDGELGEDEFSLDLLDEFNRFEPWGQTFEHPIFHDTFEIVTTERVGREREHQKYVLKKGDTVVDAIAFNQQEVIEYGFVKTVYELNANEFRGNTTLQLILNKIQAVPDPAQD